MEQDKVARLAKLGDYVENYTVEYFLNLGSSSVGFEGLTVSNLQVICFTFKIFIKRKF